MVTFGAASRVGSSKQNWVEHRPKWRWQTVFKEWTCTVKSREAQNSGWPSWSSVNLTRDHDLIERMKRLTSDRDPSELTTEVLHSALQNCLCDDCIRHHGQAEAAPNGRWDRAQCYNESWMKRATDQRWLHSVRQQGRFLKKEEITKIPGTEITSEFISIKWLKSSCVLGTESLTVLFAACWTWHFKSPQVNIGGILCCFRSGRHIV